MVDWQKNRIFYDASGCVSMATGGRNLTLPVYKEQYVMNIWVHFGGNQKSTSTSNIIVNKFTVCQEIW